MKLAKRLLITAALATLPALAFALPVTLDSPTAAFSGVTGGSSITFPMGSHDAEGRLENLVPIKAGLGSTFLPHR